MNYPDETKNELIEKLQTMSYEVEHWILPSIFDLNKKTEGELAQLLFLLRKEKKMSYHQSDSNADYNYWGKLASWNIDAAIILILGKDPRKIAWEELESSLQFSGFAKKFFAIQAIAKNHIDNGLLTNPSPPGQFLQWAQRMGFEIPQALVAEVSAMGIQIADWQSLYKETKLLNDEKTQTIEQLCKELEQWKLKHNLLLENPIEMDPSSDNYAPELDIANIAYRAVTNNPNAKIKMKEQVKNYLIEHYPDLSNEAKNRIAVIVNTRKGKIGGQISK